MRRTTVLVDDDPFLEARLLAGQEGKSLSALAREALAAYCVMRRRPRRLSFIGMGNSGNPQLAYETEELLATEVDPIQGWALGPSSPLPSARMD
jgi:hypothetical protein